MGSSQQRSRDALGVFVGLSLAAHAAAYLTLFSATYAPPLIELQMRAEVEFGVMQELEQPEPAPAPRTPPQAKPKPRHRREAKPPTPDAEAAPSDAGVTASDAGDAPTDAGIPSDAATADAAIGIGRTSGATGHGSGGTGTGGSGSGGSGTEGAQISLHIDLDLIRKTSLRRDHRTLLGIVPEWRKLLRGSGFAPLNSDEMAHVFIATPNLERAHLMVSVRFRGGPARVRAAVTRMARGREVNWSRQHGFLVAPWYNRGPTERVVALVADDVFTITRPEDLPRVAEVIRDMPRRDTRERVDGVGDRYALLKGIYANEVLALTIDNARRFVVGPSRYIPDRVRISVSPKVYDLHAGLTARGRYASPDDARAALGHLRRLRAELVGHPRVGKLGLAGVVREAHLERNEQIITIEVIAPRPQIRMLIELVGDALAGR